jgi:predicted nucleic acid-binding Zn ribbon protein
MCPYCGEDVPDDSSACWKCGTEISKGEGGASGDEITQRNTESKTGPKAECPFCQAMIPARALRCNECGRVLQRSGARANWVPAAYGAFGLVALATIVALVLSFVRAHKPPEDPGRSEPVSRKFSELERLYLRGTANETRRREIWTAEHHRKFVVWEGVIIRLDPDARRIELAEDGLSGKPTVIVEMKPDVDLSGLKEEKAIKYSARLEDYRDGQFHLSLGTLLE